MSAVFEVSLVFMLLLLSPKILPRMEEKQCLTGEIAEGEAVTGLELPRIAESTQPVVIGWTEPDIEPPGGLLQRSRRCRWLHTVDSEPGSPDAQHEQTCAHMAVRGAAVVNPQTCAIEALTSVDSPYSCDTAP